LDKEVWEEYRQNLEKNIENISQKTYKKRGRDKA